ncbi:hypothetical protein HY493_01180 [Candidatus Woesearchaeota archaeon]|nr:hypothetical protein [Candidatus Woesearchaeota archaeon]
MRPQTRQYMIAYLLGFMVVMVATTGIYLAMDAFSSNTPTAAAITDFPAQETPQNDISDQPLDLNRSIGN